MCISVVFCQSDARWAAFSMLRPSTSNEFDTPGGDTLETTTIQSAGRWNMGGGYTEKKEIQAKRWGNKQQEVALSFIEYLLSPAAKPQLPKLALNQTSTGALEGVVAMKWYYDMKCISKRRERESEKEQRERLAAATAVGGRSLMSESEKRYLHRNSFFFVLIWPRHELKSLYC